MEVIYISLFWSFCMVGAFCVGGGYASIPLIQTQVIDVHHWISFSEFMDVVAISQMTPGPIGINAATFVQRVKVTSAKAKLVGYVEYMSCSGGQCTPPAEADFSFDLTK